MSKVSVVNNASRVISLPEGVVLIPGVNIVEEKKFKKVEEYVKKHSELEVASKGQDADKISGYNVRDAASLISKQYDEDKLIEWEREERDGKDRAAVLKSISDQKKVIENVQIKKDNEEEKK